VNGKHLLACSVVLAFGGGIALNAEAHQTRAKVTLVEPFYQTVVVEEPVTTCYTSYEDRRVTSPNVAGQTLAGAIVCAAIGRQFGYGSGRDALTVLGAVAGSAVANDRATRRQGSTVTVVREPVERCTTEYRRRTERRVTGYWVEYRHRGRIYRTLSRERPGREIWIGS